jgi:hypothetical protein
MTRHDIRLRYPTDGPPVCSKCGIAANWTALRKADGTVVSFLMHFPRAHR